MGPTGGDGPAQPTEARWAPSPSALTLGVGLAMLAALGSWGYHEAASSNEARLRVAETHEVLEVLEGLAAGIDEAKGARRLWTLTGDEAQRESYARSVTRVRELGRRARQLTRDDPAQQGRLHDLDALAEARFTPTLPDARAPRPGGAGVPAEAPERGESPTDRTLVSELLASERGRLEERERDAGAGSKSALRSIALGFPLSMGVLLAGFFLLRSETARARTKAALREGELRWTTTLMGMGEGVIVTDEGGVVVQMNRPAQRLTGSDGTGRPLSEAFRLIDDRTREPIPVPTPRVLSEGVEEPISDHSLLISTDAERPVAGTVAPLPEGDGALRGLVIVFRDVTQTRAVEARFRRVVEAAPDALLMVDAKGRITTANAQAETLLGYSNEELTRLSIESLVPERFRERHADHRTSYGENPSPRPMGAGLALFARRKDGREIPVEISLSPGPDGLVIASVRDVSRRRELERFRDEYIGYVSHDLKNPLSIISLQARLLAQQLAERGMPEEQRSVEIIGRSAGFISSLVRELLEMAYVESDQVQVRSEATLLPPFLTDVLERTLSTSDRPRVRLEIHDESTGLIEANPVERVVVNLVQNALKYSPPDTPIVVRLEAHGNMARVSVIDQGAGLTLEEASFVFDKYRRTRSARKKEGLGLGLYISRKVIEAHGGQIGVESTPGEGSTFFFTVPLVPQGHKKPPVAITFGTQPGEEPESRLHGLKVLLVDDEPNAVSALATLLGEEGFVVSGATSGMDALAKAETQPPDIVVLDVEMPGMSGLALLQRLRKRFPGLPAIIMSGFMSHHAGIAEVREATGAAYISKPVNVDELVRTVRRLFGVR